MMDDCVMKRWKRWSTGGETEEKAKLRVSNIMEKGGTGDLTVVRSRQIRGRDGVRSWPRWS